MTLAWECFNGKERVAKVGTPLLAGVVIAALGDGATVRYGRKIVYTEGIDGDCSRDPGAVVAYLQKVGDPLSWFLDKDRWEHPASPWTIAPSGAGWYELVAKNGTKISMRFATVAAAANAVRRYFNV